MKPGIALKNTIKIILSLVNYERYKKYNLN